MADTIALLDCSGICIGCLSYETSDCTLDININLQSFKNSISTGKSKTSTNSIHVMKKLKCGTLIYIESRRLYISHICLYILLYIVV